MIKALVFKNWNLTCGIYQYDGMSLGDQSYRFGKKALFCVQEEITSIIYFSLSAYYHICRQSMFLY